MTVLHARPITHSLLRRGVTGLRLMLLTEVTLLNAFRVARAPRPAIDVTVYRDLADLFEAIEDDEDAGTSRDCDGLRRLADSLELRPRRLRNAR